MSYAAQQTNYREMEIQSASPEKLVCIVFEQLVVNLERARLAMERQDPGLRVTALNRARGLVSELLATLDVERAGSLGVELAGHYQVMLTELMDVGSRGDMGTMRKLIHIAVELRDGFVGAEREMALPGRKSA